MQMGKGDRYADGSSSMLRAVTEAFTEESVSPSPGPRQGNAERGALRDSKVLKENLELALQPRENPRGVEF